MISWHFQLRTPCRSSVRPVKCESDVPAHKYSGGINKCPCRVGNTCDLSAPEESVFLWTHKEHRWQWKKLIYFPPRYGMIKCQFYAPFTLNGRWAGADGQFLHIMWVSVFYSIFYAGSGEEHPLGARWMLRDWNDPRVDRNWGSFEGVSSKLLNGCWLMGAFVLLK